MGTQKSNVCRLETGSGNPSWNTLKKYAHACGFDITMQCRNATL
jgi:ribosomal protein L37E